MHIHYQNLYHTKFMTRENTFRTPSEDNDQNSHTRESFLFPY